MTRPLFEQYKDALRRGHLAARAVKVDEALAAYAEAAKLAPDRAAPHSSSATVLHRAGRDVDALAAFERALAIAPDDEATIRARASVYRDLGRLASAAADLEHLAEALDADGRRADALVAAREAVTLTATAARRALVARLEAPEDESAPRPRPSPVERAAAAARQAPPAPARKLEAEPLAPPVPAPTPTETATIADPVVARLAAIPDAADAEAVSGEGDAEPPADAAPAHAAPAHAAPADAAPPEEPTTSVSGADAVPAATPAANSSTLLDLYDAPIEDAGPTLVPSTAAVAATMGTGLAGVAVGDVVADAATMDVADVADVAETSDAPGDAPPIPRAPIGFTTDVAAPPSEGEWSAPARRSSFDLTPGLQSDALVRLEEDDDSAAIPWPAIDLPSAPPPPIVGPPPDPETLMAEALALIDAGNPKDARNLLLTAVMVHRAAGRPDAALDVCLQLLALAPGDAHVHLAIAGLQLDRGWRTLATDKIGLLLRLTALTGDTQAEADAHALAAERLRDEVPTSFARA